MPADLTSLQFRDEKGAITREIQSNLSAPKRLRIVKRGEYVYMALGTDADLKPAGGWIRIPLHGDFYVGLGVCSHDKDVVEQARFSNVELTQPAARRQAHLYSARSKPSLSIPPIAALPTCRRTLRGTQLDARRQRLPLQS